MVVHPGVREHADVDRVVGMVMTDDHVGDVGYHEPSRS